ncbi:MAG TPA: hypothetical protein VMW24_10660 [Sedimentisphaerales bacterium]|nr:hypothetical protein [Sedimentisphaerales bacterium]
MPAAKGRMHSGNTTIRRAYQAGWRDGQADAQKLLSCCVRANSELWESLLHLDEDSPAGGTGVTLPLGLAENLVKALRKPGAHRKHAQLLAGYVKRANQSARELVEKLEGLAEPHFAEEAKKRQQIRKGKQPGATVAKLQKLPVHAAEEAAKAKLDQAEF